MKSLEEYERERGEAHGKPMGSGIACPQCGAELTDEGRVLYMTIPPRKRMTCFKCKFSKVVLA